MAWTTVSIINCRKASIRATPWIPIYANDIIDVLDGLNTEDTHETVNGVIDIDPEQYCYDWTDRKFYKTRNPDGWIYEGCIDF